MIHRLKHTKNYRTDIKSKAKYKYPSEINVLSQATRFFAVDNLIMPSSMFAGFICT